LAIANGGIETNPEWAAKVEYESDDGSLLAFVDLDGHLIAQHRLPARFHTSFRSATCRSL